MASRIEIGVKGGHSSSEVIRHIFGRAGDREVAVRVSYQLFVAGERAYVGLRDHTVRYRVNTRRDFEDIHAKVVQFIEDMLDRKYGLKPDEKRDGNVNRPLTAEEQEALTLRIAEQEAEEDERMAAAIAGDAEPPTGDLD